jgi:plastocyanin
VRCETARRGWTGYSAIVWSNRSVVIGGALAAVAVFALVAGGCGSSTGSSTSPTNPEGTNPANLLTVTIKNGVYSPNPVMVKVGQSVNWLNSDSGAHTATDTGVFDTGSIAPTSAADGPVLFNSVGTFNYHCSLHANETASIVVTGTTVLLQLIHTHPILTEPLQNHTD